MERDIYFEEAYGKLYEEVEKGKLKIFQFKCEWGVVRHLFIQRKIPISLGEETLYDIITPYGYGGPIVECETKEAGQKLIQCFEENFYTYCVKENIVCEFIRFHPLISNEKYFKQIYDVQAIRKTLGTHLAKYEDPVQEEFSKSCRKSIRQALRKGVTYEIIKKPDDLKVFMKIYYNTMERNGALDYYYFNEQYFENCIKYFKENIVLIKAIYEGKVIAAGVYFTYGKVIHVHLSGTLKEYLHLSPAYILRYAITKWGKENGYKLIHHGGGRSNSEEDALYRFKKQFAKHTSFDFYVGRKIWLPELYQRLCEAVQTDTQSDFFPAYRKERD